ncbi:hypothetical protein ON010_g12786 [Phytophthora cinnamomi]|nr:hypothetical protein ON010_g12786 [Phytophthora cinnamomi]
MTTTQHAPLNSRSPVAIAGFWCARNSNSDSSSLVSGTVGAIVYPQRYRQHTHRSQPTRPPHLREVARHLSSAAATVSQQHVRWRSGHVDAGSRALAIRSPPARLPAEFVAGQARAVLLVPVAGARAGEVAHGDARGALLVRRDVRRGGGRRPLQRVPALLRRVARAAQTQRQRHGGGAARGLQHLH